MPEKIEVLVVGAKRNGYRRAGLQFGESAASIPLSALTSHQVKELTSDRMLATSRLEAIVLPEAEYAELKRTSAIGYELTALVPTDYTWSRTPVEFVTNLVEQLRVQTERANGLQATNDALNAQVVELEQQLAAKSDTSKSDAAAKPAHASGRK